MADLKISQLTGATTPLAGTEVLPIVQSSTTKKVTVDNLTAGKVVNIGTLQVNISSNPNSYQAIVQGKNATTVLAGEAALNIFDGNATNEYSNLRFATSSDGPLASIGAKATTGGAYPNSVGQLEVGVSNGPGTTHVHSFHSNGDETIVNGNLIQGTAAKGVNFTANTPAAGMTSQLLNWYEEGTWTPNQGSGLTVVGAFSSAGVYTRVGRQVTVTGRVTGATSVDTSTSGIVCTNLPFTVGTNSNSVGAMTNTATNNTYVYVNPSTTTMYSSTAAGASGSLYFTVTYSI